jgi:hypothetical protein
MTKPGLSIWTGRVLFVLPAKACAPLSGSGGYGCPLNRVRVASMRLETEHSAP